MESEKPITNESSLEVTESKFKSDINKILQGEKGLSYSSLSKLLSSPKHFKAYKTGDYEQTEAMKEGVMFHEACLEPEVFKERYWVFDDSEKVNDILTNGYLDAKGVLKMTTSPRSVKPYKEWKASIIASQGGEMVKKELYDTFLNMSEAIRLNNSSKRYMGNLTKKEAPLTFEYDGFKINGKIDGEGKNDDGLFLMDLKKVADASFHKVKWDIKRMNYDMQAAMYSRFSNISNYVLIYIDMQCNITVVKLTQDTISEGWSKFQTAIDGFCECAKDNAWNSSYDFWNGGEINF